MIPKTFSATAAQTFTLCEARYKAEVIDRTPRIDGEAGLKGSFCHAVLEMWVGTGQYKQPWPDIMVREKAMHVVFDMLYYDYFDSKEHYAECWGMCNRWLQRTTWDDREVLSTESKETFELPTSVGPIPMTYIFDRSDHLLPTNEVEVIDYKTVMMPVQVDDLKNRIQPRFYAVAANIKYPWASGIWLTYDLLRWDTVSARFSREDNVETWKFMRELAERIIASDGTKETLNIECQYCIRKHVCETLTRHGIGGGVLGITDMHDAANRRAQYEMARKGLQSCIDELDNMIMNFCEEEGIFDYKTDDIEVKIAVQSRRHVESERVAKIVGPMIMQKYGKIGVTDVDTILKDEDLTDEQKSMLKQSIKKQAGKPRVTTKLKSAFEEA